MPDDRLNEIETANFLRLVLDTMPGQVVVRDVDSIIAYANRAFAEAYGKTVAEVQGQPDAEFWAMMGRPPEEIERWLAEDREVLESGQGLEYIQEIVRTNGERAYFQNFKVRLILPNGQRYLLAQYADITERRRFERWLAQEDAVAAELAGIRKTTVTYAHEVNNPLTGILGLVQLMLESEDCSPEFREMLLEISAAAHRITGVIQALEAVVLPKTREYLGRNELLDLRADE